jgi:hypothetical protein
MVYPALLPLMRTPRLPVVDWTDAPVDLNRFVYFAERQNLDSARAPSHLKRGLLFFTEENAADLHNVGGVVLVKDKGSRISPAQTPVKVNWKLHSQ